MKVEVKMSTEFNKILSIKKCGWKFQGTDGRVRSLINDKKVPVAGLIPGSFVVYNNEFMLHYNKFKVEFAVRFSEVESGAATLLFL